MKATTRITKNTIPKLLLQIRCYEPGKLSSLYDLSIYTDNQIEELAERMECHKKKSRRLWSSSEKLESDIASERRDRRISKILA